MRIWSRVRSLLFSTSENARKRTSDLEKTRETKSLLAIFQKKKARKFFCLSFRARNNTKKKNKTTCNKKKSRKSSREKAENRTLSSLRGENEKIQKKTAERDREKTKLQKKIHRKKKKKKKKKKSVGERIALLCSLI